MNVLSLFDGMSCGMIALERAGINVEKYYASEIDKYAMIVSKANYPNIIQLGSIVGLQPPENIDLLIGGSPCQGFSFAGKQLAFDDPRSKLFFEWVRIWKECKPKFWLLENVKMKKESEQMINNILGCKPLRINSELVSALNRPRLYWTNIPVNSMPVNRNLYIKDIYDYSDNKAYISDSGIEAMTKIKDRSKLTGNGYRTGIKTMNDKFLNLDANYHKGADGKRSVIDDNGRLRLATPLECERLQTVPDNYTNHVSNTQRYKMLGNGWTVDVIAHIFKHIES